MNTDDDDASDTDFFEEEKDDDESHASIRRQRIMQARILDESHSSKFSLSESARADEECYEQESIVIDGAVVGVMTSDETTASQADSSKVLEEMRSAIELLRQWQQRRREVPIKETSAVDADDSPGASGSGVAFEERPETDGSHSPVQLIDDDREAHVHKTIFDQMLREDEMKYHQDVADMVNRRSQSQYTLASLVSMTQSPRIDHRELPNLQQFIDNSNAKFPSAQELARDLEVSAGTATATRSSDRIGQTSSPTLTLVSFMNVALGLEV